MYRFENAIVNGANGGLGSQFVEELIQRGAGKVFVTFRPDVGTRGLHKRLVALMQKYPDRILPIKADSTKEDDVLVKRYLKFTILLTVLAIFITVIMDLRKAYGKLMKSSLLKLYESIPFLLYYWLNIL